MTEHKANDLARRFSVSHGRPTMVIRDGEGFVIQFARVKRDEAGNVVAVYRDGEPVAFREILASVFG